MKYFTAVVSTLAAFALTACGSNDGGNTAANPGLTPLIPLNQCTVGQVYSPQYGCLNRQSCNYGYGYVPSQNTCVPGTVVNDTLINGQTMTETYGGQISFSNKSQFDLMFRWAGQCDVMTWNYGNAKCSYWSDMGGYLQIFKTSGTNPSVTIAVFSGTNGYTNVGYWKQVSTLASIYDYNNSQGMQLVSSNSNSGIRVVIERGRFGQGQNMTAQLQYQGINVGTVNLIRTN